VPYCRYPTIAEDRIVYVAEDDLWLTGAEGGTANRLTALRTAPSQPLLSPDGQTVVFIGREEGGADLYAVRTAGGPIDRLTHLGDVSAVCAFHPDGRAIVASAAKSPFAGRRLLYAVSLDGGEAELLPVGPAAGIAFGPDGAIALQRGGATEPAHWKRYRGGRAGRIWVRPDADGAFAPVTGPEANAQSPMWLGGRLHYLADGEGYGNLYACDRDGGNVERLSAHAPEYARNARTDGRAIVYHAAGDLWRYDPQGGARRLEVRGEGEGRRPGRRFVDASRYLDAAAVHPDGGRALALAVRGKLFAMGSWEGPAVQLGTEQGVRYRLPDYLPDGERVVMVSDEGGEEAIEVHALDAEGALRRLAGTDTGWILAMAVRPAIADGHDAVAVTNHRLEVLLVDLETGRTTLLDRAEHGRPTGLAWSPDGRFVAYSFPDSQDTRTIRVCDVERGLVHTLTRPVLRDYAPAFSPDGRLLYFLSQRSFDPVADNLEFAFSFPRGVGVYAVVLRRGDDDPFLPVPKPVGATGSGGSPRDKDAGDGDKPEAPGRSPARVEIDLDGIEARVVALPVREGRYVDLAVLDGKVLYLEEPLDGERGGGDGAHGGRGVLRAYDLGERRSETLVDRLDAFTLSADRKAMLYRLGRHLRVVKAGTKVDNGRDEPPGRRSGWVDLGRPRVEVDLSQEWRQMVRDAWRQMRDWFWHPDLGGVDWAAVYARYAALAERVASRDELSDLLWEMQGEIGTSHAYERGEAPEGPRYPLGSLAADVRWDETAGGYRVERVVQGDTWSEDEDSPLRRPGVGVGAGDLILAVNGRPLDRRRTPSSALVDLAGEEVALRVESGGARRTVRVRALRGEGAARYREWVDANRAYVHEVSGGRVGYVHVPDMMIDGYAEFHRGYLAESQRDALILDVRYNRGGAVSWLLMDKLRRKVISYRVFGHATPQAFPRGSVRGPVVCLTNGFAGSDGDAVCQEFKAYAIGPVIGSRTWGGTIGISGERRLVDGTAVTQPEMRRWFAGPGWNVENHGVDPDIEVEERPEDAASGHDRQLERASAEILRLLAAEPPLAPPDPATAPPTAPPVPPWRR